MTLDFDAFDQMALTRGTFDQMALTRGVAPITRDPAHDAVVLNAVDRVPQLLMFLRDAWSFSAAGSLLDGEELKPTVSLDFERWIAEDAVVDLAILYQGCPFLHFEVKSKAEAQSASAWTRQIKRYAQRSDVPCILLVAHELGPTLRRYLQLAKTPWLDLRTFK